MSDSVPVFGPNERFQVMDTTTARQMRLQNKRGTILQHYLGSRYRVRLDGEQQQRIVDACLLCHISAEDEARWAAHEAPAASEPGTNHKS